MRRTRAWIHRRRFGWPGTEPPEGRNPIRRWGAIYVGAIALLVVAIGQVQIAAAMLLVALVLGAPRAWTLANDRFSSAMWALSAVLLIVGEIVYIAGGSAARASLDSRSAGAGPILIGLALIPALVGFFYRWGTVGNPMFAVRMAQRGDPEAFAAGRKTAAREGWKWGGDDDA